jgi:predicted dithiol-disulfide oxidoreductase (DUF899 family)
MATSVLEPAAVLAEKASKPFPGDSDDYRRARTALITEEIELRRHIERVAAQRRALPPGGIIAQDYRFIGEDGQPTTLSAMFGAHDTLVVYFWMFGPERERPCPMCTSFIGGLDIPARDITQRVAMAIVGRSPVERQLAFKAERGWHNLKFHATTDDDFVRDHRGFGPDGSEWPILAVFTRRNGEIRRFWVAEAGGDTADPGQDPRLAPDPDPLWTILDLTPAGRGSWYPKLEY